MTAPLTLVTVSGRFVDSAGMPLSGAISLSPSVAVSSPAHNLIIGVCTLSTMLDSSGYGALQVVRSDDPALSGVVPYYLSAMLSNGVLWLNRLIVVTNDVDLSDYSPYEEPPNVNPTYILSASLGVTVAPLVNNLVPAENLPTSAGGEGVPEHTHAEYVTDTELTPYALDTDLDAKADLFHVHDYAAGTHSHDYADPAHEHDLSNYATLVASEANAADAVAAHEGAVDPHPGYVTESDPRLSDARTPTTHTHDYATVTNITDAITVHETEPDPHPGYVTDADLAAHGHPGVTVTTSAEGTPPTSPEVGDIWMVV